MAEIVGVLFFFLGLAVVGIGLWWLGFHIWPARPAPHPEPSAYLGSVSLPPDLPAPVTRFFQLLADPDTNGVPRTVSAVTWGRARLRLKVAGIRISAPAVFREHILAGQDFRWTAVLRWFRLPASTAVTIYRGGRGEYRAGKTSLRGAWMDQAENLRLWAEGVWMPGIWFSAPGVRWEPAGGDRATLVVPGPRGQGEERLEVEFDPSTGFVAGMRAARYRGPAETDRASWRVACAGWDRIAGVAVPRTLRLFWDDVPAGELYLDGLEYNVDVTLD